MLIHSGDSKFSLTCFCNCDFIKDWESASEDENSDDSDESWIDVHHSSDDEAAKPVSLLKECAIKQFGPLEKKNPIYQVLGFTE